LASFAIVGLILRLGPSLFRSVARWRFNLLNRSNATAFQLVLLLVVTGVCILLSVPPMLGALVAGTMVVSTRKQDRAREAIQSSLSSRVR
jgi:Kef-type K+ transport system membrane component KefB